MLNYTILSGRLSRDPEIRDAGSSKTVKFSVVVDRDYKAKDGSRSADFIECVAWAHTAEFVAKYFEKGSAITVEGCLEVNQWTDKEGKKRSQTLVRVARVHFPVNDSSAVADKKRNGGAVTAAPAPSAVKPPAAPVTVTVDDEEDPF